MTTDLDGIDLSEPEGGGRPVLHVDGIAYGPSDETPHGPAADLVKQWRDAPGRTQKERQLVYKFLTAKSKGQGPKSRGWAAARAPASQEEHLVPGKGLRRLDAFTDGDGEKAAKFRARAITVQFTAEETVAIFTAIGDHQPEEWAKEKLLEAAARALDRTILFPKDAKRPRGPRGGTGA